MTHEEQRAKLIKMMVGTAYLLPHQAEHVLKAPHGHYTINVVEVTEEMMHASHGDMGPMGQFKAMAAAGDLTKPEGK